MSKKTTFAEQDDILEEGDGGVAEEEAPLMEETKVAQVNLEKHDEGDNHPIRKGSDRGSNVRQRVTKARIEEPQSTLGQKR